MREAHRELDRALGRINALYASAVAEIDLDSPMWRAADRDLDDAFAAGGEEGALIAVAAWEGRAVALLRSAGVWDFRPVHDRPNEDAGR